jgi:hypothetical protein
MLCQLASATERLAARWHQAAEMRSLGMSVHCIAATAVADAGKGLHYLKREQLMTW